jgi:2-succinyl-5-enolpyruvyl-6-hydroxy-3-cyclohexene-1-carboxylate synthase
MSHRAESEPHQESCDREKVLWHDQESVVQEEAVDEVNEQENLLVEKDSEFLVAVEEAPVPEGLLVLATEPVVLTDAGPPEDKHTRSYGWDVAKENVHDDVVPPALSEVGQDMLHGQLDNLVEQLPEVKHVWITNHEGGQEPVTQVHDVVVIHVVPYVLELKFAVVIVGVHFLGHWLVQARVKEAERCSTEVGSHLQHED